VNVTGTRITRHLQGTATDNTFDALHQEATEDFGDYRSLKGAAL
jgi:hypothetical protein